MSVRCVGGNRLVSCVCVCVTCSVLKAFRQTFKSKRPASWALCVTLTLNTDLHHGHCARGDDKGEEACRDADEVYEGGEEEAETPERSRERGL